MDRLGEMRRLLDIMAALRDPDTGCPWDRAQSFATIAPYTIEEAYEVADAIAAGNLPALREELGDLLFQVVYHAQLAEEAGAFGFAEVAGAIADKMVRRHPHVFGDAAARDAGAQSAAWEAQKARERAAQHGGGDPARIADELGDMLFVLANLARKLGQDPETCLHAASRKFTRRFDAIEASLAATGATPEETSLAAMEAAWQAVKARAP